jgi:ubiquinone/menaquinone biosynthesis C-methylase UbiE
MGSHVCPWWFAYTFDNPLRTLFHKPELMFSRYVSEGMTVADIGCGLGYFSIGLARLVRESGKVIAVDIQGEMLDRMVRRASKQEVREIISPVQCGADNIGIDEPLDFALAFWMAHETPDVERFFAQVHSALKPGGLFFITEPKIHVSAEEYRRELEIAGKAGFTVAEEPPVRFSHAALLRKADRSKGIDDGF